MKNNAYGKYIQNLSKSNSENEILTEFEDLL